MKKGQGLLETTIAISVLITGITAVMGLTYSNASTTGKSSNRIIAANLAREAIEAVHFKRDTNWIQGLSYNSGLSSGTDYTFSTVLNPLTGSWILYFSPNALSDSGSEVYSKTGLYLQTDTGSAPAGGNNSNFRRIVAANLICRRNSNGSITIRGSGSVCVPTGGARETEIGRQIIASVDWSEKSARQSFIVEDRIYDWR